MNDFDTYAKNYDSDLNRGLAISGEDSTFFARGRVEWLKKCITRLNCVADTVLDFGCGVGNSTPLFFELLGAKYVVGVDLSQESLFVAKQAYRGLPVEYRLISDLEEERKFDLVFCNGVLHHIPPNERSESVRYISKRLKPNGIFSLWENNPWNPGTRYIMSRIPFDKNAIPLTPREASLLVMSNHFDVIRVDYCFIFPSFMKFLRVFEKYLTRIPLGAQYQVLSHLPN